MSTQLDTQRLLRSSNPVPNAVSAEPLDASATALLQRIVNHTDPEPGPSRGRRWLIGTVPRLAAVGALALVTLVIGVSLVDSDDGGAYAATPTPLSTEHTPTRAGAVDELLALAARAEGTSYDAGPGGSIRVVYQSWSLFTRIDGVEVSSEVVPQRITRLVGPDGQGTITTEHTAEGETTESTTSIDDGPQTRLAADVDGLTAQLADRNPSGAAGRVNAIVESLLETPAGPGSRGAVLRYLAQTPGIRSVGEMEDRLGREGVGFTVSSDASGLPTSYTLIFDPRSGNLLGYEEMLTSDPGKLQVPIPSVIQYVVWEQSTYTS